jgi:hypothetical protein
MSRTKIQTLKKCVRKARKNRSDAVWQQVYAYVVLDFGKYLFLSIFNTMKKMQTTHSTLYKLCCFSFSFLGHWQYFSCSRRKEKQMTKSSEWIYLIFNGNSPQNINIYLSLLIEYLLKFFIQISLCILFYIFQYIIKWNNKKLESRAFGWVSKFLTNNPDVFQFFSARTRDFNSI